MEAEKSHIRFLTDLSERFLDGYCQKVTYKAFIVVTDSCQCRLAVAFVCICLKSRSSLFALMIFKMRIKLLHQLELSVFFL